MTSIGQTPSKTVDAFDTMMAAPSSGQKIEPLPGVGLKVILIKVARATAAPEASF